MRGGDLTRMTRTYTVRGRSGRGPIRSPPMRSPLSCGNVPALRDGAVTGDVLDLRCYRVSQGILGENSLSRACCPLLLWWPYSSK